MHANEEYYNDLQHLQDLLQEEQFKNKALMTKCDLLQELNDQHKCALAEREKEIKNLREDMHKILEAQQIILRNAS